MFLIHSAYGSLTVRSLLDTREHCMEEFHFADPYSQVGTSNLSCYDFCYNNKLLNTLVNEVEIRVV